MKFIGGLIIICALFIITTSYANVNYNSFIPQTVSDNYFTTEYSTPFSTDVNNPTVFPAENVVFVTQMEYDIGYSVPSTINVSADLYLSIVGSDLITHVIPHIRTALLTDSIGEHTVLVNLNYSFTGFVSKEYKVNWDVNMNYEVNNIIYYVYSTNTSYYGKIGGIVQLGTFFIHKYIDNWENISISSWTEVTTTPLFLPPGEYILIYYPLNNVSITGVKIKMNNNTYNLTSKEMNNGQIVWFRTLKLTSTVVISFYINTVFSTNIEYENSDFIVVNHTPDYVGIAIGVGLFVAGIFVFRKKRRRSKF